uniref:Protein pelota homolog n=1 Tax=Fervidicoccus fontis TaxID=683846 RepID=A0A7J3ZIT0_9CREN
MQFEFVDSKRTLVRFRVEREEDLWILYTTIKPGDRVRMRTTREVKQGAKGHSRSYRIPMTLTIRVSALEFQPFTNRLRIRGVIVDGPEEYGLLGSHHTFSVSIGSELYVYKEGGWSKTLLKRLERAIRASGRVVIVAIDYDEYAVGVFSSHGLKLVIEEELGLHGKGEPSREKNLEEKLLEIAGKIEEIVSRENPVAIIIGGPGFLKDSLIAILKERGSRKERVVKELASMGGSVGVKEIVRRKTPARLIRGAELERASEILDEILYVLSKNPSLVAIGLEENTRAALSRAFKKLLVLDELLASYDEESRRKVELVIESAEEVKAEVVIVPANSPVGERLKGVDGVASLLRFPLDKLDARA